MSTADLTAAERHDDEINFGALLQLILGYKRLIVVAVVVCTAIGVTVAVLTTPIFRSEVVVTEVTEASLGGASGLAGQLGGLANLAGLKLPAAEAGQRSRAVLQSRALVEQFIQRKQLLNELFPDASKPPTLWRAVKKFKTGVLFITEDTRKGTITVAINWTDPDKAASWANEFVALANEVIRTRAIEDSERNIEYLNKQIANTNIVEMQRVMYNLIENESKTLMLAKGRIEYAFAVVDPAVSPEIRIKPQRTLIVLVSVLLGLVIGVFGAFAHRAFKDARTGMPGTSK
ncbi:MAG TPA: Wzz/FepE/Etk N-terminal domain-containing protein [Steroidobacteraceae bacterium]|nr:Wzz/FepE/Etk N-terminal domain-containing protein [Steroidobacteraceae bacterium]